MGNIWVTIKDIWHGLEPTVSGSSYSSRFRTFVDNVTDAVRQGDLDLLERLQKQGQLVLGTNIKSLPTGSPLLCQAAATGRIHIVKYLLDEGVNVDEADSDGMTSLHHACRNKKVHCLELLLTKSREIDRRDIWLRTPLIKALVYRCKSAAQLLLEKGANPNAVDVYGTSPVTIAVDYNCKETLHLLVKHGADINQMNQSAIRLMPPLYLAINNQSLDMVHELLSLGATTLPRPKDYFPNWPEDSHIGRFRANVYRRLFNDGHLIHGDALSLAKSELLKRGLETTHAGCKGAQILNEILTAHGEPLSAARSPDVLINVLSGLSNDFLGLLYKFHVCSSYFHDDSEHLFVRHQEHHTVQHRDQLLIDDDNNNNSREEDDHRTAQPRPSNTRSLQVMSLQNISRRVIRSSVMKSGRNVVWATHRLQCPPGLKSLILLRDIDKSMCSFKDF